MPSANKGLSSINQKGVIPLTALIIAVAIIGLVAVSATFSFKSKLFSALFPKPSSSAATTVDLSLSPTSLTVTPNSTFSLNINMDTKGNSVAGVTADIIVDPTLFQVISMDNNGGLLPNVFQIDLPNSQHPNDSNISLGASFSSPVNGAGKIATITLKALAITNAAQIRFNTSGGSIVSIVGGTTNVLGNTTPATVSVSNSTANFTLVPNTTTIRVGDTFKVAVNTRTDTDAANTFNAKIVFDPTKLQVDTAVTGTNVSNGIDGTGSFLLTVPGGGYADRFINNTSGLVSIIGTVPTPGYKTTGADALLANINFKAIAAGATTVSINPPTANANPSNIYRNSDNQDILNTALTPLSLTINSAPAPTPTPTVAPTATTTATPNPSTSASVAPTATPRVTPTATPTVTGSPVPTATPAPVACAFVSAAWNLSSNPVNNNVPVNLSIVGNSGCAGKSIAIDVREDDGLAGSQDMTTTPLTAIFPAVNPAAPTANLTATSTWTSRYIQDGIFGVFDPPEYFFIATVQASPANLTIRSANPEVMVNSPSNPVPVVGDINNNGAVDLQDLSILLSHFAETKTSGQIDFPDRLDLYPTGAPDGAINTFDFSAMLNILSANGTIHRTLTPNPT